MTELDEQANGRRVAVRRGGELVLRLEENPTAGFRWQLDTPGAPTLSLRRDTYEPPARGHAGAPGHHLWIFRANEAGAGRIELSYRRRFGGVARTFAVLVEVRA